MAVFPRAETASKCSDLQKEPIARKVWPTAALMFGVVRAARRHRLSFGVNQENDGMGSYHGPKARINRRLGVMVFESAGAVRAAEKRPYPPGMARSRKKLSTYGLALREKQKIKYYYGLRERQLRRFFQMARRAKGNTGEELLILCERRLDNVVRRAGFTVTRPQARQGVAHCHFQLNGRTVSVPSILVRPGDVISVRKRPNLQNLYRGLLEQSNAESCDWLAVDKQNLEITVLSLPTYDDVSLPVDVGQVVAFMSR